MKLEHKDPKIMTPPWLWITTLALGIVLCAAFVGAQEQVPPGPTRFEIRGPSPFAEAPVNNHVACLPVLDPGERTCHVQVQIPFGSNVAFICLFNTRTLEQIGRCADVRGVSGFVDFFVPYPPLFTGHTIFAPVTVGPAPDFLISPHPFGPQRGVAMDLSFAQALAIQFCGFTDSCGAIVP